MSTTYPPKIGDEYEITGHTGWNGRVTEVTDVSVTIHWYRCAGQSERDGVYDLDSMSFQGNPAYFCRTSRAKPTNIPKLNKFSLRRHNANS